MGRIRIEKKHKKRESIQHIPIAYHNNKLILGKVDIQHRKWKQLMLDNNITILKSAHYLHVGMYLWAMGTLA